eukprot:PLAT2884.1.p1 GENE.PLAT2884.1~~PLAT2884.1.p1  ORF type:complete len:312 (+),score=79.30 PLAT2884.1:46-981(+)
MGALLGKKEVEDDDSTNFHDEVYMDIDGVVRAMPTRRVKSPSLRQRRRIEGRFVAESERKDSAKGAPNVWFVVHAAWLEQWTQFVRKGRPLPGPIPNMRLLTDDGMPLEGLQLKVHYRVVTKSVWEYFLRRYGGCVICRREMDIESDIVDGAELAEISPLSMNATFATCKAEEEAAATSIVGHGVQMVRRLSAAPGPVKPSPLGRASSWLLPGARGVKGESEDTALLSLTSSADAAEESGYRPPSPPVIVAEEDEEDDGSAFATADAYDAYGGGAHGSEEDEHSAGGRKSLLDSGTSWLLGDNSSKPAKSS